MKPFEIRLSILRIAPIDVVGIFQLGIRPSDGVSDVQTRHRLALLVAPRRMPRSVYAAFSLFFGVAAHAALHIQRTLDFDPAFFCHGFDVFIASAAQKQEHDIGRGESRCPFLQVTDGVCRLESRDDTFGSCQKIETF